MELVYSKPWVGDHYRSQGLFNKRTLILGWPYYALKEEKTSSPDWVIKCIEREIQGDAPIKLYWINVAKTFLDDSNIYRKRKEFWPSVAFHNYLQTLVGADAKEGSSTKEKEVWETSDKVFQELINEIKPQFILTLGLHLWVHLTKFKNEDGPPTRCHRHSKTYYLPLNNGDKCLVYGTHNASSYDFEGYSWYWWVKEAMEFA